MYDELILKLRKDAEFLEISSKYNNTKNEFAERISQAADAIEELSHSKDMVFVDENGRVVIKFFPKWIPVTERLPEHAYGEGDSVLTVSSLGSMRVLYFDGGNWCYPTGEALTTARKYPITHWMPLPEPPKESE